MNINPLVTKQAQILVNYSVEVKKGEKVAIVGTSDSESLIREIYKAVLLAGGYPNLHMSFSDQNYVLHKYSKDFQLDYTNELMLWEAQNTDVAIQLLPNSNPYELTTIDPAAKQRMARAASPIMEAFFKRVGKGKMRWVASMCPTDALAQEAKMPFEEYAGFAYAAMKLYDEDPVKLWKEMHERQEKICSYLSNVEEMRYMGLDTNLSFSVKGRRWVNCSGKLNFPDGEVYTAPREDSVEGTIRFTYPGIFMGEEIQDVFLRFEKGKVIEAQAAKGQELLNTILDTDGGSRYVGEIAIGTNDNITQFTKNMLFDEKMGGTIHLALGMGYPESGSKNQSAIHWDLLKDMKERGQILADSKTIYENGEFLIARAPSDT
ncbi:MAG: aminopeptidase [Candidatus Bathyarchaeota archaeon]|nr:aminopeptidase [Candidatus Bathyarchaeota archaeon]